MVMEYRGNKYKDLNEFLPLNEWCEKYEIHSKIEKQLDDECIASISEKYGGWNRDIYEFKGIKNGKDVRILLISKATNYGLEYWINSLYKMNYDYYIVLMNTKAKYPYFKLLPHIFPNYTFFHRYRNGLKVKSRKLKKDETIKKLKPLFDNIPNLLIQPKAIYAFGSILRNKEEIGDVDLFVEFYKDEEYERMCPEWYKFKHFFEHDSYTKNEIAEKFKDIISEEEDRLYEIDRDNKPRFKDHIDDEMFWNKIKGFGLHKDILKLCNWTQVTEGQWRQSVIEFGFRPEVAKFFSKMFINGLQKVHIQNYIYYDWTSAKEIVMLWSQERTNFIENYTRWKEEYRNKYIKNEYQTALREDVQRCLIAVLEDAGWKRAYKKMGTVNSKSSQLYYNE
jgi:predicted nucleotidyltransferase